MPNGSIVFVDTNILIYAQDPRDAAKRQAAELWLSRCWQLSCGRVSSQVMHELYANLRRQAPSAEPPLLRQVVMRYRAWAPWQVDDSTVDLAWELQDRYGFNYWDALMVAAAQMQGCELLLTEDLQHGQRVDKLRIVNPFLVGPELLDAPA